MVCSDSVAKKVDFSKVKVIIGTELPTRANDYRTRLSYAVEGGLGITFYDERDADKVSEIDRVMNRAENPDQAQVAKPKPAKKETQPAAPATDNAPATAPAKTPVQAAPKKQAAKPTNKASFGGHIPEFLKIDISHLIKGE